ncbi:MAG: hypothetical protein CMC91_07710 [Flavobacteriaceae bacterium]|nr:hypothetical protein [Flavobacteriaceae bacterium]MBJ25993.1 hypothetical protein [Flavobacteriaceae bacterium]|tara:strand:+ start:10144 stop:10371 length:228 start_codon:yes stop_codon:yes gene_type:complete
MKKKLLFNKKNYLVLSLAILTISTGFIIMSGGESKDPMIFNDEIFNFQRIRLAPALVLFGFALAIYSIFVKSKSK